jgi:Ser/Thr protein kinase RdoA (MazF antagonist)
MAEQANSTTLDIEKLNQLATRLRDDYVDVRNPGLARDLDTAADVASAHAHFRFVIAEVADALPWENPAKKELLELIGKEG